MTSARVLNAAAVSWLATMLVGQWAFFYYIAAFYGVSTFAGDFETWNRMAAVGIRPFIAGDTRGNLAFAAHALGAGLVALGGALQLVPQIRARAPAFHRWNGRVFLVTVTVLSLSGFYLVWFRGSVATGFSTSINGALILTFAFLTYRAARARDFTTHRRWAMRLFLVSNAQWFVRVGVFGYFIVGKALGVQVGIRDPFVEFWAYGCFLVPLAVLELYLRAKESRTAWPKVAAAGVLATVTLLMAAGMFAYAMFSQRIISGAPLTLG